MLETCSLCGRIDDTEEYIDSPIKKLMEEKKCCFHCAFWFNIAEGDPDLEDPSIPVIVDGSHWSYPSNSPIVFNDSNGWSWRPIPTMHYILFENGKVEATNILWHQGTIPNRFRELLPNNAVFINCDEYNSIQLHISNKGKSSRQLTCPQPLLNFLLKKYNFSK